MDPPPGFELVAGSQAGWSFRAWVRPEAVDWVRRVLDGGETLSGEAEARAVGRAGAGRGSVPLVPAHGEGLWAVRHYWRGGFFGPLLGDRYLRGREGRPFREARASEAVRRLGLSTPEVVAAARYLRGAVERGDLVTRYLPDARELRFVLAEGPPEARSELLRRVGRYVARLGTAGIHHRDLNAGNLLVEEAGPGLHLLDLDRCAVRPGPRPGLAERMLHRLERSLEKESARQGIRLEDEEWEALRDGAREGLRADSEPLPGTGPPPPGGSTGSRRSGDHRDARS